MQRIFKCDKIQDDILTPEHINNLFHAFYFRVLHFHVLDLKSTPFKERLGDIQRNRMSGQGKVRMRNVRMPTLTRAELTTKGKDLSWAYIWRYRADEAATVNILTPRRRRFVRTSRGVAPWRSSRRKGAAVKCRTRIRYTLQSRYGNNTSCFAGKTH